MSLELKQHMKLSQQLVMTPQLQQAIKLLQLSRMELQELIREEIEKNPLLEEPAEGDGEGPAGAKEGPSIDHVEQSLAPAEPPKEKAEEVKSEGSNEIDWDDYLNNYQLTGPSAPSNKGNVATDDMPSYQDQMVKKGSLFDHLAWQIRLADFTEDEEAVAFLVLGNLDDGGYLRLEGVEGDPLIVIAREAGVSHDVAAHALKKLQKLDPPGVCARDLQECLLLQARALGCEGGVVGQIIKRHMKLLEARNLPAIEKAMKVPLAEVVAAAKVISEMDPRPGRHYNEEEPQYITPDVYVHKVGDKYMVVLNDDGLSKLRISSHYRNALKTGEAKQGQAKEYIQDKMRSAVWLIRSIHQRQRTIHKVTESIVKFQQEFFDKGIAHLKPLILKDVAEDIGMHESTVSRVTTNKYVHTPQGIFELKYFFNSGISKTGGDEVASEAVKNEIKHIVAAEDSKNPYSDQKIVEILRSRGIEIARRTVAKYREVLNILPSSKRKAYF